MDNKVNLSKVAQDLGVSVSTVSRALSGNGRISEETRQNIKEYLRDKQLIPNTRKKKYTDHMKRIIAVTVPIEEDFFHMPYFQTILSSIYDFFSARNYQVIPVKTGPDNISDLEKAIQTHAMDGVVVSRQVENQDETELLKKYGVPFVVIGFGDAPDMQHVGPDTEQACFELTDVLIHNGCRKIAIMGAEQIHPVNQKRFNGIKKAFVHNYMVLDREYIFWETESLPVAEQAVRKIRKDGRDCIICMDDHICLRVLLILQKMGIRIPHDIKVASLHNSDLLDTWNPSVTCIHYDNHMLGREAARLLYVYLTENRTDVKPVLGYEIQIRESTK